MKLHLILIKKISSVQLSHSGSYNENNDLMKKDLTIYPADILFGDSDGIIVASDTEMAELIPLAEEIQQKEEMVLLKLRKGESLLEYLNFEEHLANVKVNKKSELKFRI